MTDKDDFKTDLFSALKKDMTVMLAVEGKGVHARPMTAQFDGDSHAIYFFTTKDTEVAEKVSRSTKATITFASKGHDLFAHIHGKLTADNDRALIDRLWNRFVAAWFEGGKDDPKLTLLRFDAEDAEVWKDASSLVAGVRMFLGMGDPKEDYKDKFAEVNLR